MYKPTKIIEVFGSEWLCQERKQVKKSAIVSGKNANPNTSQSSVVTFSSWNACSSLLSPDLWEAVGAELWQIPWATHFYLVTISVFSVVPVTFTYLTSLLLVGWLMIFVSTHVIEPYYLTIVLFCITIIKKNTEDKTLL